MLRAARSLYLLTSLVLGIALLFPALGWVTRLDAKWGDGRVLEVAIGIVLLGLIAEHLLGGVTRLRQKALAQALLRLKPTLRHKGAIEILIRALESQDEKVSSTAHRELKRITQQEIPADPAAWREWLESEEKATIS